MITKAALIIALTLTYIPATQEVNPADSSGVICYGYRKWQEAFTKRYRDVLDDKVEHLTYKEFVAIKEGNVIPEMEKICN